MRSLRWLLTVCLVACAAPTAPEGHPVRVVLIGDSLTAHLGDLVPWFGNEARQWTNAGIGGNRAINVLERIPSDVPPDAQLCVVLVGVNDILGGAGQGGQNWEVLPPGTALNGYLSVGGELRLIVDQLRTQGVAPILSTLLPLASTYPNAAAFNARIRTLNAWLRDYGQKNRVPVIDQYEAFVGADGFGQSALYVADGLHLTAEGMTRLTETERALLLP